MSKSSNVLKSRPVKAVPGGSIAGHVQILRDRGGDPAFAVVPWADYQRLIAGDDEDAALIAAADAARNDESFPDAVARRLLNGEAPLKVIREWRGMTQEALSKKTDVPAQYLSQLERRAGGRNVGRKTAAKLAPVLKVSVEALMDLD